MFGRFALILATLMPLAAGAAEVPAKPEGAIRFATYNVSLYGDAPGAVADRLEGGADPSALASAAIIRAYAPDVLLVQELDRDDEGRALALYAGYLGGPAAYPYRVLLPSNTGIPSGVDLNGDGAVGTEGRDYGEDALGYGLHPGQYAFALLSRHPLGPARTFSNLLWRDMPESRIPEALSEARRAVLPLSSKTHALVPVEIGSATVWVVAAHPTPPLPGNPLLPPRNADEIRLIADLLDAASSAYAVDDTGVAGGLPPESLAVVMGDLNADPAGGNSLDGAIAQLVDHPALADPVPVSPAHGASTAKFRRGAMRVDYVLPSAALTVVGAGVHWPEGDTAVGAASDHRLVYVDVMLP